MKKVIHYACLALSVVMCIGLGVFEIVNLDLSRLDIIKLTWKYDLGCLFFLVVYLFTDENA